VVIEYNGKRYPVVGENGKEYLVTEPWMEDVGELIRISKSEAKLI
jgi:hypothetical protein